MNKRQRKKAAKKCAAQVAEARASFLKFARMCDLLPWQKRLLDAALQPGTVRFVERPSSYRPIVYGLPRPQIATDAEMDRAEQELFSAQVPGASRMWIDGQEVTRLLDARLTLRAKDGGRA